MECGDMKTELTAESELKEGDAIYLRFVGEAKTIRRFEPYTSPYDFTSRIAWFTDGTGMTLEKGHYYMKVV